jgi:hypothetical protein
MEEKISKDQQVLEQIKATFPPFPLPDTEQVNKPTLYAHDPERLEIAAFFKGKSWTDLSLKNLRFFYDALGLFSPAAFRCFLPGFMAGVLKDSNTVDVVCDSVVFNLRPSSYRDPGEFRRRMEGFTREQQIVIRRFLEWFRDEQCDDRAGKAIAEFWGEFGP